jgi:hypothetical protein
VGQPQAQLTLPLDRIGVERINKDLPAIGLLSQHKSFSIAVEKTLAVHYDRSSSGMMCAHDGDISVNIDDIIDKGRRYFRDSE